MRAIQMIMVSGLLCGCISKHNLATDGYNPFGGGYLQRKVHDGIFEISVKTNRAPFVNAYDARTAWRDRAKELCGSEKFREFNISEGYYFDGPREAALTLNPAWIVSTRDGFAVCESANLSDEAARELIRKQ